MIQSTKISAILARDKSNAIGKDTFLPWKDDISTKWDMKNFKLLTTGNIIFMGFNTCKSLKNPLPDRINVVENRTSIPNKETQNNDFSSFFLEAPSLFDFCARYENQLKNEWKDKKIFLIGGAKLIKKYAELIDELYLTTFDRTYEANIFLDDTFLKNFKTSKVIEKHDNGILELYTRQSC